VNSTRANTIGFALMPVLTLVGDDVPANGGVLRAVDVRTRPGTIVHALPPSAVGWSPSHCGLEVAEAAATALRQAVPDPLGALTAPAVMAALRATSRAHDRIDLGVWALGAGSAGGDCDGWGRPGVLSRGTVPSVEAWEVDTGVAVRSLEHVTDSGGAGRRRGAPAMEVVFDVDRPMTATFCVQGRANPVAGVGGGLDGAPAEVWLAREGGPPESAPGVAVDSPLAPGEVGLRFAGGAGYGDPLEREPELVAVDVADGYVSAGAARSEYGVVLRSDNSVDAAATAALRGERRTTR
jgi:N-methylhydantoinase B